MGMDSHTMQLFTSDDRMRSTFQKYWDHVAKMCANPRVASETYRYLISHADVEDVAIEPFSCFLPEPTAIDPEMQMTKQMLQKLVTDGTLSQEDMDYYLAEAIGRSAKEGNFLMLTDGPFEIRFHKKQ